MYLSKLEIIGFKSFAQKVNLSFDSGISAIVGPNGCGKTNIVDAIRWVLGEQRYSALRSEKMEDVIFNGTKSRKPLGMAEASLVIENNKGILPSEYTQVTVGRRVFRSGESEYLLNKVPCRLKDILDLFMDTGMGADAYSVIELKMVEIILSDRTEERRRLFEEAAGVTKYKHRRKAAYRKLEAVQADLVRVNDIVLEVQKAVNSLERQARKAEQYNDLKTKLRAFEIDVMEREYAQLLGRVEPLQVRFAEMTSSRAKIDVDLSREEAGLEELRQSMNEAEKRLIEAQRDVSQHMEKVNRIEQKNLVAAERSKALHDNIQRYEREREEQCGEKTRLEALVVALGQTIIDLTAQQQQLNDDLTLHREQASEAGRRLDEKESELAFLSERTLALVQSISERQRAQDKQRGRVENLNGRMARAAEENREYEDELVRLAAEVEEHTTQDKQLRRQFSEAEVKYYEAEKNKKELEEKLDALQREEMDVVAESNRIAARIDFLKGLIESKEGFSEGVRFLSTTDKWNRPARQLTVADAVHAEDTFAVAIEAALGEHAGLIVVDSTEEIERGVSLLKEEQKGKATFVALNRLPLLTSRYAIPKEPGVCGWAIDHARFDPLYDSLFHLLLDRVLIVEDAATAKAISTKYTGIRCVTLEGETTSGAGMTRGGSRRLDEGGVIGKQNQIEALQREFHAVNAKLSSIKQMSERVAAQHDAIDLKSISGMVKDIEKEMNAVEMRIAQLEFERKRARDVMEKNTEEIQTLNAEANELLAVIASEAPELDKLREEKTAVEQNVGAATSERETLESDFERLSKEVNELEIKAVQLGGTLQNTENESTRSRESIAAIALTLDKRETDIGVAQQEISHINSSVEEDAIVLGELMAELSRLELHRSNVERENLHLREEMHRIQLKIRDERRSHDDTIQAVHDLELKIADLKAKIEHLKERAFTEFELQLEVKTYPEDEFVDFAALRDEIQRFRDKIKSLGNINFAAFEEYTEEKQRFEFLSTQRDDLIEAEKTLLATIEEINATAQAKFLETFEKIRQNFIETFKSLFDPGDECDLKLEEDVDPLEAGIDIIAKPRGKRPTSIHLLSGGEKTLTATALLFAIYLVKPSPFCILDEVDAPLDDANIDRFTRIIRKFSDNTQFIVVTHNKRTMEAANALYGVTMEEEGVSKLVTVRFNQGSQVQSAAVVSG
ncbi:MAG: chromosome segregation protein SMC [Bacteroidetes bacterium]|nr:chromosome segregation protein SMC [Bacteroidota bacterium]MCW5895414.1 chromosome segregation protein SMC [Bacteroidota bacterium]